MNRLLSLLLCAAMLASVLSLAGCSDTPDSPPVSDFFQTAADEEDYSYEALDSTIFDQYIQAADSTAPGYNMIADPDFSGEKLLWSLYTESGGKASLKKADGQCVVSVSSIGISPHSVQLFYDAPKMHQFAHYEWKFTVQCSQPGKVLEARIQLNGGDYSAYVLNYTVMTGEPQSVTIPFVMTHATDPKPRLAFNLGSAYDGSESAENMPELTFTFDDISLVCTDDSQVVSVQESVSSDIIINQLGYAPESEKIAVFRGFRYVDQFKVIDSDGKVVYTGTASEPQPNDEAWEYNWYGDFSAVTTPGTYRISAGVLGQSYEFTIGEGLYDNAFDDIVRMFYMQRCGCDLPEKYAGEFAHPQCHANDARIWGTDTFIDVSGGWHDAGDYGRYIVPAAKAVADLINAYTASPEVFNDKTGIPESGNGIPDILDEVRYELDWMLKMQDSATGGVYHKVTCAQFPGNIMPQHEKKELIVCPVSTCATADFAAAMAAASIVYADFDADFARCCLEAAKKAWDFLEANPKPISAANPSGISTGEYPDSQDSDERCWAAALLYRATGDEKYHDAIGQNMSYKASTGFGWADTGSYAAMSYLSMDESLQRPELSEKFRSAVLEAATAMTSASQRSGYGISLTQYSWGSNMTAANNAMLLILANDLSPNEEYLRWANRHLDYLFGANPVSVCFVTGYGTVSPVSTHHRPSLAAGTTLPGMLVGGVNENLEDPHANEVLFNTAPAKCYVDNYNSYSCNEVTIYWNSPLVYVMTRLCK